MRPSDEIHNYPALMEQILHRIAASELCEANKKAILRFHDHLISLGLSLARQTKYLATLLLIARKIGRDFSELTRDDITQFVKSVELSDYTEWTKHDYKVIFKIFYRWLKNSNTYPDEVAWIRCKRGKSNLVPEELISISDLHRLFEAAFTQRDRAFILVLFDSGCRIGELLSLRIKNVAFDNDGALLNVTGKTGSRRVRIIASVPALSAWINNHPLRGNPDSPVWISLGSRDRGQMMTYSAGLKLVKMLAKRAGLTKRIYPHLFRHSRATMLAKLLPEAFLYHHGGWVQGSKSAAGYVHVSSRDLDRELFRLQGIRVEEEEERDEFRILTCGRCGRTSSPFSKACGNCGLPFDSSSAARIDELKQKADKLISALVGNEDILDKLLNKIDELKSS